MSIQLTFQMGMNLDPLNDTTENNPNVWPGDKEGNPITPEPGIACFLWARILNDGTEEAKNVQVSFFIYTGSEPVSWPGTAHAIEKHDSLAAGVPFMLMCTKPWTPPALTQLAMTQILGVVSCDGFPPPATKSGSVVDVKNSQIALHDLFSITLHHDMGGELVFQNPNLWVGNELGDPIVPKNGVECYLWANVFNNGNMPAHNINVTYAVLFYAGDLRWPKATGTAAIASLEPNQSARLRCFPPWVPDSSITPHQCLVAAVNCDHCPIVDTAPGDVINPSREQAAQHNTTIAAVTAASLSVLKQFYIMNTAGPGVATLTRLRLAENAAVLMSLGIDTVISEAPEQDSLTILNRATGADMGTSVSYEAGQVFELALNVSFKTIKPGTAALYTVSYYEQGKIVNGIGLVVLHQ